jgi:hypothetical protein
MCGGSAPAERNADELFCVRAAPRPREVAVLRRTGGLPPELAPDTGLWACTDWRASVELSLAMHARYRLTIASTRYAAAGRNSGFGRRRKWLDLSLNSTAAPSCMNRLQGAQHSN